MKEIEDIIQAFDKAQEEGRQTALATIVHIEGSSYRQPGARMLITDEGQLTGAISGGCLEGDVLRKALLTMQQQQNKLITYDTTDEDDTQLGAQLGCNGIVHILIEPIDAGKKNNPIELLRTIKAQQKKAVIITLFSLINRREAQWGSCLAYLENGRVIGNIPNSIFQEALTHHAQSVLLHEAPVIKEFILEAYHFTAFIELIKPDISLVIIGAGNDAIPLAEMAALLGWHITVVDGRPAYANRQRFPKAHNIIVAKGEEVVAPLTINEQTVVVLMTHNYNYDLAVLRQLIPQNVSYIGLLGPKKKAGRLVSELKKEGMAVNEEYLSKLYAPVGLDMGAETAEEIALSVIAEIKTVLAKRSGNSLRDKPETIHLRNTQEIEKVILSDSLHKVQ